MDGDRRDARDGRDARDASTPARCVDARAMRLASASTLGVLESGIGSFLIPYRRTSAVSAECPNVPIAVSYTHLTLPTILLV